MRSNIKFKYFLIFVHSCTAMTQKSKQQLFPTRTLCVKKIHNSSVRLFLRKSLPNSKQTRHKLNRAHETAYQFALCLLWICKQKVVLMNYGFSLIVCMIGNNKQLCPNEKLKFQQRKIKKADNEYNYMGYALFQHTNTD